MPAGDDTAPLAAVIRILEELAGGAPVPAVVLTDRPTSSAYPARPWRPARLEIRREIAGRGPSDALRGEIAHEYAHVLRPDTWRHFALALLATEIGALGTAAWLVSVVAPWSDPAHRAHATLYLGLWLAGVVLICLGVSGRAWASHRRELRADALAAELLGGIGPMLATLDGCQTRYERLGGCHASAACSHTPPPPAVGANCSAQVRGNDRPARSGGWFSERGEHT
jgi:Zn-dependent protease with chaperone function